jgi:hypothetical protein
MCTPISYTVEEILVMLSASSRSLAVNGSIERVRLYRRSSRFSSSSSGIFHSPVLESI